MSLLNEKEFQPILLNQEFSRFKKLLEDLYGELESFSKEIQPEANKRGYLSDDEKDRLSAFIKAISATLSSFEENKDKSKPLSDEEKNFIKDKKRTLITLQENFARAGVSEEGFYEDSDNDEVGDLNEEEPEKPELSREEKLEAWTNEFKTKRKELAGRIKDFSNTESIQILEREIDELEETLIEAIEDFVGTKVADLKNIIVYLRTILEKSKGERTVRKEKLDQEKFDNWVADLDNPSKYPKIIALKLELAKSLPVKPYGVDTPEEKLKKLNGHGASTGLVVDARIEVDGVGYFSEDLRERQKKHVEENYFKKAEETLEKLNQLIEDDKDEVRIASEERSEKLTLKTRAKAEIEKKWALVINTFQTTSGQTQNDIRVNEPWSGKVETSGVLAMVDEFFPDEKDTWALNIKLWNAFVSGAGRDPYKQLGWEDAYAARKAWRVEADFEDLVAFSEISKIKPAFNRMKDIFKRPQTYIGKLGASVTHDYAKDGNPGKKQVDDGVKTVQELLKDFDKSLDDSSISSLAHIAIMGELRLKYHARSHGGYMKSADGTYHTKALLVHAPLEYLGYKMRAYGKIFPEGRLLWQILRHPPKGGIYQEDVTIINRDHGMPIGKNHVDEFLPHDVTSEDLFAGVHKTVKYDPNSWDRSSVNDQVREAIETRVYLDRLLTTSHEDFTPVQLDETQVVIPYYWDVIFNYKDMGLNPVTAAEYNSSCEFWLKFLEKAQNPRPINHMGDVNDAISDLVASLSPTKPFLYIMPEGTPLGDRFRNIVKQILLRYTKYVYNEYDKKAAFSFKDQFQQQTTKRGYFFKIVKSEYKKLGTLDGGIKQFILDSLSSREGFKGTAVVDNLFTTSPGFAWPPGNIKRKSHVLHLIEQYTKPPSHEEKKE